MLLCALHINWVHELYRLNELHSLVETPVHLFQHLSRTRYISAFQTCGEAFTCSHAKSLICTVVPLAFLTSERILGAPPQLQEFYFTVMSLVACLVSNTVLPMRSRYCINQQVARCAKRCCKASHTRKNHLVIIMSNLIHAVEVSVGVKLVSPFIFSRNCSSISQ